MRKTLAGIVAAGALAGGGTFAADTAVNPYDDKGTHYELPIKADIPQGERVEIAKDRAAMTLKGWNDEYAITIVPQIPARVPLAGVFSGAREFKANADRRILSKKMEYREDDVTAFIEPKEGSGSEFDIDFTLDAKPETNVFEYRIEGAEDFDFFYQPPLNEEEQPGTVSCSSTECLDANGEIAVSRSENVIGSFAVYHKTKASHLEGSTNYATGKAFHIYRPKAIDANGAEVWAELSYAGGVLSVTVPQKFLDGAAYPVVVDPTFGYTTQGGTFVTAGTEGQFATKATATENGDITSYSAFVEERYWDGALYTRTSDTAGTKNGEATDYEAGGPNGTGAWITITWASSVAITSGTTYWLFAGCDTGLGTPGIYYDAGSAGDGMENHPGSGAGTIFGEDPMAGTSQARLYSIYATYTAGSVEGETENVQDGYFLTW